MYPMKRHVMLTEGKHLAVAQRKIHSSSKRCFTKPALSAVEGFNMTTHFLGFAAFASA
jgi:hypothetical protein